MTSLRSMLTDFTKPFWANESSCCLSAETVPLTLISSTTSPLITVYVCFSRAGAGGRGVGVTVSWEVLAVLHADSVIAMSNTTSAKRIKTPFILVIYSQYSGDIIINYLNIVLDEKYLESRGVFCKKIYVIEKKRGFSHKSFMRRVMCAHM